jgi:ribosomal protein S12 methylthiotransferase accessory factor
MSSMLEGREAKVCTTKCYHRGTHRTIAPERTLARICPLMPVMGITRLADITGLDRIGIPVVVACRPNSRSLAVSQGKGTTLAAAKASALMESVESYHAERIVQPLKLGTLEELRYTHAIVDIDGLPRSSEGVFDRDLRMLWIEGHDVIGGTALWVPYELVHTDYTASARIAEGRFQTTSNGLASGNNVSEALSHALCEVIERDANTLWDLAPEDEKRRRRLDLETVDDPGCHDLLVAFARADVAVGVWDMTSDIGIAAFVCVIVDRTPDALHLLYPNGGMGCHPCREVALSRALTEAAQSRLTGIVGSRDDMTRADYERFRNTDLTQRVRSALLADGGARPFESVPAREHATVGEDVSYVIDALRHAGIEQAVAIDLSLPGFGISVVRVVVPGLEGVRATPQYVPGRRALAAAEALA